MNYRPATVKDIPAIRRINNQPEHRYDLDTPEFVIASVVENDEGKIIAFGGVKVIHESIAILDQTEKKQTRTSALKLLIRGGCALSKRMGIPFWHAFCDANFALFLQTWFDYKPAEGINIILDTTVGSGEVEHVEERREEDEAAPGVRSIVSQEQVRVDNPGTSSGENSSQ